jgi:hypothetical protein
MLVGEKDTVFFTATRHKPDSIIHVLPESKIALYELPGCMKPFFNPLNQHHQDIATMLVMHGVKNEKK